jgi:hypothetical protein
VLISLQHGARIGCPLRPRHGPLVAGGRTKVPVWCGRSTEIQGNGEGPAEIAQDEHAERPQSQRSCNGIGPKRGAAAADDGAHLRRESSPHLLPVNCHTRVGSTPGAGAFAASSCVPQSPSRSARSAGWPCPTRRWPGRPAASTPRRSDSSSP